MSKIILELRINDMDISNHEVEVRINGCTVGQDDDVKSAPPIQSKIAFGSFIDDEIKRLLSRHRLRSAEIHKSVLRQFLRFRDGKDIWIDNVTDDVIKHFENYLQHSRNLSLNTISFNMRVLRSCYNKAIEKYQLNDRQPFKHVYTGIEQTNKRALDIEAIKIIKTCELTDRDECFARDMFMFSFYTRGMSFVDMAYLNFSNLRDGNLYYKRHKTGQSITVKWERCMQDIVDCYSEPGSYYLFPIIHASNGKERNQYRGVQNKVNAALKKIAMKCELRNKLTMYVARHSWANIANSLHQPLELISYGMGHTSTKTTKIYLHSINMSQIDQLNTIILQQFF